MAGKSEIDNDDLNLVEDDLSAIYEVSKGAKLIEEAKKTLNGYIGYVNSQKKSKH